MAQAKPAGKEGGKAPEQAITYTIYVHAWPAEGQKAAPKAEQQSSSTDMDKILGEAQKLHDSSKYQKVEVKKKYVEEKTGRTIDITLRMFESKPKRRIGTGIVFIFAVLCGLASFGATYMLTKDNLAQAQNTQEEGAETDSPDENAVDGAAADEGGDEGTGNETAPESSSDSPAEEQE